MRRWGWMLALFAFLILTALAQTRTASANDHKLYVYRIDPVTGKKVLLNP